MVLAQESAEAFTPLYVGTWMRWRWRALQQPVFESPYGAKNRPRLLNRRGGTVNFLLGEARFGPSKVLGSHSAGTRHLTPHAEGAISERTVVGCADEVPPNPKQVRMIP
jgi:hypothetical protein